MSTSWSAWEVCGRSFVAKIRSFHEVELLRARLRIDDTHSLAFLEKDALHPDVGFDRDHVVIDEKPLADGALVFVAEDYILKIGGRVGRRRGSQADLDRIKVIERLAP